MTLEEMRERKRILGYSNETLANKSGVPLGTVQKVMAGVTKSPRQKTLEALAAALSAGYSRSDSRYQNRNNPTRDDLSPGPGSAAYPRYDPAAPFGLVREPAPAYRLESRRYTTEDIYALPEGIRAELIDGIIYYIACPGRLHQDLVGEMYLAVTNHIRSKGGSCKAYVSPFAVFLDGDDSTYVEPDLSVICDAGKLDERGCCGAPDWIVEVVSPSSRKMDHAIKLFKYRSAGVREFWLIYPERRTVLVHIFEENAQDAAIYSFEDEIPSHVLADLTIRLADTL